MSQLLTLQQQGRVAIVTLCRPPANALNHAFMAEMCTLLPRLRSPEIGAVILTAEGRFFSAGLDLFEVFSYSPEQGAAFATAFDDAITGFFALPMPLIAAINGHAVAGGTVLAATADFRLIADGEAKMGLTEIQVGVPFPASAMEAVRYACAGPHLTEVLLRGQTYLPKEAVARSLADEVVPAAELMPRALKLAEELAGRLPVAVAPTKLALRADALAKMAAARASGADPTWNIWRSQEVRAAMDAYRNKLSSKSR